MEHKLKIGDKDIQKQYICKVQMYKGYEDNVLI